MGGRGSGSAMNGRTIESSVGKNAVVYDSFSNLPTRIKSNQRWVMGVEFERSAEAINKDLPNQTTKGVRFIGKYVGGSTVTETNATTAAKNGGFKTTRSFVNEFGDYEDTLRPGKSYRTGSILDPTDWRVIPDNYKYRKKPVLVTIN